MESLINRDQNQGTRRLGSGSELADMVNNLRAVTGPYRLDWLDWRHWLVMDDPGGSLSLDGCQTELPSPLHWLRESHRVGGPPSAKPPQGNLVSRLVFMISLILITD
jgi:hypothetical protein